MHLAYPIAQKTFGVLQSTGFIDGVKDPEKQLPLGLSSSKTRKPEENHQRFRQEVVSTRNTTSAQNKDTQ